MIDQIQPLIDAYYSWLRDNTFLRDVDNDWVELTTPYIDRHNDFIQIYISKTNGDLLITDDAYTINELKASGCDLSSSPKRIRLLELTLNGFGVQRDRNALTIKANQSNFAYKKHNLIQAILAVNDMFYLAEPTISSLFKEDVEQWLRLKQVRFVPMVKFTGKSGYDHSFDFAIPQSNGTPERIIKTVSNPTRDMAQNLVFAWFDTRNVRPENSQMYAILNDSISAPASTITEALTSYEIKPVLWTKREAVYAELAK
ncbi:MAG: DUF1829 domain-containing protein [Anaerolineales bacterium]